MATTSPFNKLTDRSRSVLRRAALGAKHNNKPDAGPAELLHALAFTPGSVAAVALEYLGWKPHADGEMYGLTNETADFSQSAFLLSMAETAHSEALAIGHHYAGTEHVLLALVRTNPELFTDPEAVRREVLGILGHDP